MLVKLDLPFGVLTLLFLSYKDLLRPGVVKLPLLLDGFGVNIVNFLLQQSYKYCHINRSYNNSKFDITANNMQQRICIAYHFTFLITLTNGPQTIGQRWKFEQTPMSNNDLKIFLLSVIFDNKELSR